MPNLETFAPQSAKELLEGMVDVAKEIIGKEWSQVKSELTAYLSNMSTISMKTAHWLKTGAIPQSQADLALHGQEIAFNQFMLLSQFVAYEVASKLVDGIFDLIVAAIKNITGITVFKT